jgi:hypothetical protein
MASRGYLKILRDITERKLAQDQIRGWPHRRADRAIQPRRL